MAATATATATAIEVEAYVVPELISTSPDEAESRLALINKLGLSKQKELIAGGKPTLRFRRITSVENVVFQGLFPRHIEANEYSEESIPLQVLELIEKARDQGLHRPTIWCPEVGKPDPVCVMYKDERPYYNSECYLIARWGHPLLSFEALCSEWKKVAVARASRLVEAAEQLVRRVKLGAEAFQEPPNLASLYL